MYQIATAAKPAGGAELAEVVGATLGATLATAGLLTIAHLHRSGRTDLLRRVADWASRLSGLPYWSAFPSGLVAASLLCALFGMYWDISLHIDDGRDEGPLANPAHYFILIGLFGVFAGSVLAIVLPEERPSRVAVRIGRDLYAPLGALVLLATSSFSLAGFPLDDLWHRLFGQDVTLWGPTHLMLIGGAGVGLIGHAILFIEGGERKATARERSPIALLARWRLPFACGGLLLGLSTFQAEFDFGVPQFRLLFHPVLIAAAGGVALVAARIFVGRGGALVAVGFYLAVRGALTLLVGPVAGETLPHFPLYLAEALLVELVALRVSRDRPYLLGGLAGLSIATVGFAAEWGWSHVWMPNPWPEPLLAEALPLVLVTGVAAGLVGGFVGTALAAPLRPGRFVVPAAVPAALGVLAIAGVIGYGPRDDPERGMRAELAVTQERGGPAREVELEVRLSPRDAADDANWVQAMAWQGGGRLVLDQLERVAEGVYRTGEPLPAHGSWKTLVRVHRDDSLVAVPVYLPEDRAIPVPGVPLRQRAERTFVEDKELLQREQKDDVPGWLPPVAYAVVGLIALALICALGYALRRLTRVFATAKEESPWTATPGTASSARA